MTQQKNNWQPQQRMLNHWEVRPIDKKRASEMYKNGSGFVEAAATAIYHALAPEDWSMFHSEGLKNQVAAAIAYHKGLPPEYREHDPSGYDDPEWPYVGYAVHGALSGQDKNINKQGTTNNGIGKILGGFRYHENEDGSIIVKDTYSTNITRDFTKKNSNGTPYVYKKGEDPYKGREWVGFFHDIFSPGTGKTVQNLVENVLTRQGKSRRNYIYFKSGEINRRTKAR